VSDWLFAGDGAPARVIFGESGSALLPQNPTRAIGGSITGREVSAYLRTDGWVAVQHRDRGFQLFDASADPALRHDLAGREPEVSNQLRERLQNTSVLAGRWRTARDARWKLTRIPEANGVRYVLYDLENDPGETRDVGDAHPAERTRLREALDAWLAAIPEDSGGSSVVDDPEAQRALEEQLRSLGYVE